VPRTLPISEVKTRLPELVSRVSEMDDEIVVTKNGRPAAMIVSYEEYRRQQETLDVLADPGLMEQVRESREFYRRHSKGASFEDVFGEPLAQVKRVRSRRARTRVK
jgi:prevent-host-death family protein